MKTLGTVVGLGLFFFSCNASKSTIAEDNTPDGSTTSHEQQCAALSTKNCKSAFDCADYEEASLAEQCDTSYISLRYGQACGHRVVEKVFGDGDTLIAFYDKTTGELQGWWAMSDTLDVDCAGEVPEDCVDYGGVLKTENQCSEPDSSSSVSSSSTTTDSTPTAISTDATSEPPDSGMKCCPISDEPDCCMDYGGSNIDGCGRVCDGMPWPSEPGWHKDVDALGCPIWVAPPQTNNCCGCGSIPVPDSGTEGTSSNDAGDSGPGDSGLGDSGSGDSGPGDAAVTDAAVDAVSVGDASP